MSRHLSNSCTAAAVGTAIFATAAVLAAPAHAGTAGFEVCTAPASCQQGRAGVHGGEFSDPDGVAVDSEGNVYVVDSTNERIQKFDSSGNWERAWGKDVLAGGGTGFEVCTVAASCKQGAIGGLGGEFADPYTVATDSAGNVYVVDASNERIQKFDSFGNWERAWGEDVDSGGGTGFEVCTVAANCKQGVAGHLGGEFFGLAFGGIATDLGGNVYVADSTNERIQKFDSSGNWERAWGKDAVTGGGTGFEVCTVAASCQWGDPFGGLGGELTSPVGVAADAAGNVYVADTWRIQKFDSSGNWERAWGKDVDSGGGTGFEVCTVAAICKQGASGGLGGEFSRNPFGVAADAAGNVYLADSGNQRIEKFDSSGNWERAWGKDVVAETSSVNPTSPLCADTRATIVGTGRSDRLRGTRRRDVIAGLGGNDRVSSLGGNDLVCGGRGNDTIKGGAGNDKLYGQQDDDKLSGQAGSDTLRGGDGEDILRGGPGKDRRTQ